MSKYKARGTEGGGEMATTSSRFHRAKTEIKAPLGKPRLVGGGWVAVVGPVLIYAPTSIASPALVSVAVTATVGS
jgi:hypothetical protein